MYFPLLWQCPRERGQDIFRKQARKSSEDTQVAGYARFEKVWAE